MNETWTIRAALSWVEGYLERRGDSNPRLAAQHLLSHATGLSRLELYVHFDKPLTGDERDILRETVKRRATGEPLQYIFGEVEFRFIPIKVRPGVLIPRPETEVLVDEVLQALKFQEDLAQDRELLVADLCTGTGCIACSIVEEFPLSRAIATDIDKEALSLARENVQALGLGERVEVVESDLGDSIANELMGCFNVVVSNPPYIPTELLEKIPVEVSNFEPRIALDGGKDGLDFFRRIASWSYIALIEGGTLLVELHEESLVDAKHYAESVGFSTVEVLPDLAGRDRIIRSIR